MAQHEEEQQSERSQQCQPDKRAANARTFLRLAGGFGCVRFVRSQVRSSSRGLRLFFFLHQVRSFPAGRVVGCCGGSSRSNILQHSLPSAGQYTQLANPWPIPTRVAWVAFTGTERPNPILADVGWYCVDETGIVLVATAWTLSLRYPAPLASPLPRCPCCQDRVAHHLYDCLRCQFPARSLLL